MKVSLKVVAVSLALVLVMCAFTGCSRPKQNSLTGTEKPSGGIVSKLKGESPAEALKGLGEKRKALTSYTMSMDMGGMMMKTSMKMENGKVIKMRSDMGKGTIMIVDNVAKVHYMYDAKTNTAMKMPIKEDDTTGKMPEAGKMPDMSDLEKVSSTTKSETIDGVDCWLIEVKGPDGSISQSWIDKEYGLPRQMKLGDKLTKIEWTNINSVPDSEFELPAGAKVQDMGAMMKGGKMPGMPGM